jgi:hemoglobin-like flavoprotein
MTQQLSGRTLDNEEDVLETITEVLSESPKDEVKSAFVHWKERYQWVADYNGEFYRN